jgi:hypothetical protein
MICPHCEFTVTRKNGKDRHGNQRYICPNCGKTFSRATAVTHDNTSRITALERRADHQKRQFDEQQRAMIALDDQLCKTFKWYKSIFPEEDIPF